MSQRYVGLARHVLWIGPLFLLLWALRWDAKAGIVTTTCTNTADTGTVYEGTSELPHTLVPDCATTDSSSDKASRKYIIYQHGKALEGWMPQRLGGTEAVYTAPSGEECRIVTKGSDTFNYCYYDILNEFANNGFTVISFIRPTASGNLGEHMWTYAARAEEIVDYLKAQGVPSKNIIVAGFSRGGTIAQIVSYLASDSSVKYASLAGCLTDLSTSVFYLTFLDQTRTYTIAADSNGDLQATVDPTTTVAQYTYPQGLRGVALNLVRDDDDEGGACASDSSDVSFDRATEGFQYDDVTCSDSGTGDVTDCSGSVYTGHEMFYQADTVWINKVVQWINEPGGELYFGSPSYGEDEGVGSAVITVQRTGFRTGGVTVDYATIDGTATAGADYVAASGTLTFGPGETAKTFTVSVVDDSSVEDNETINFTLSNPTGGASLGTPDTAVLIIANNDVAFRFKDASYSVSESGGTATIRVEKLGGTPEAVSVDYATSDGTATAGTDYVATSGTLSFVPGDPGIKTFTIPILNDTVPEPHETVNLALSNPTNPRGAASVTTPGTAVLTILNDDVAFRFTSATYSVGEGDGQATITVERIGATPPSVTVSVDYGTGGGTATAGADYIATSGRLTFGPGERTKTFTVTISDDSDAEDNETVNLSLSNPSNPSGAARLGTPNTAMLTIVNNDVAFRFVSSSYTASEAGGTVTIAVEKLGGTPETVSVDFATSDGTAKAGTDYVATSGTLSFAPGDPGLKTFSVTILDNTAMDGDKTVNLTLTNPTNPRGAATLGSPSTAVLTILNDDVNTPGGANVLTKPVDSTTGTTPVSVQFANVTQAGTTSLTTGNSGSAPPSGFQLGNPPTYYEITTTALYSGSITMCINYSGVSFDDENNLKLYHLESGIWVDRTISLDTTSDIICASVTSLSPFALFEPIPIPVTIDIKPGSFPNSINLGSGGTVPVAIFSTQTFDARTLNPSTITLASAPVKLKGQGTPMASFQDVNGDGLVDIVVHVSTSALQLSETDTAAVLRGKTLDGRVVKGTDSIRVVP